MRHARTRAAPSSVLALTVAGALAGCEAKTGLELERRRVQRAHARRRRRLGRRADGNV